MAKRKEQIDMLDQLKKNLEKYNGEASKRVPQNALERLAELVQTTEFENLYRNHCAKNPEKDTSTAPEGNKGVTYYGSIKSLFTTDS